MSSSSGPQPTAHESGGLSRREVLRRGGAIAGGAVVTTTVGSGTVPRFSPIGRAEAAVPLLPIGVVGLAIGSAILSGGDVPDRGTEECQTLERVAIWADATRTFISNEATNEMLDTTTSDLAEFSVNRMMAEIVLGALEYIEDSDDPTFADALAAGEDRALGEGAQMQRNILNETALFGQEAANLFEDVSVLSDTDASEVLQYIDYHNELADATVPERVEVEVELVDGET